MEIALKIDVDTHRGLGEGVPRLMRMLEREGVGASFFVAMGPDNSGRAVLRVVRNRGFVGKMFRTRALATYGLRTVLSGTLLPSRPIALAYPETIRELKRAGFEVGVHGYDHARWQDCLDALGEGDVGAELFDAFEVYRAIFAERARSFAAPGWRTNARALMTLDQAGLSYRSDTRGRTPYRCVVDGQTMQTLEIPTTLPTLDEVIGRRGDVSALVRYYLGEFKPDALNVHTAHAEVEGMAYLEMFGVLVRALKDRGARFVRLEEVATRLATAELPVCEVIRTNIAGRAGWVSAQGSARPTVS